MSRYTTRTIEEVRTPTHICFRTLCLTPRHAPSVLYNSRRTDSYSGGRVPYSALPRATPEFRLASHGHLWGRAGEWARIDNKRGSRGLTRPPRHTPWCDALSVEAQRVGRSRTTRRRRILHQTRRRCVHETIVLSVPPFLFAVRQTRRLSGPPQTLYIGK